MRVLVTGHNGYIGPILTTMLKAKGHEVVGLDTNLYSRCTFGDHMPTVDLDIPKDIRDVQPADLEDIEGIIHLAALSNDPLGNLNPNLTYDINHQAAIHLAKVGKSVGVKRFVFASSCSTYGAAGDDMLTEAADFNPVTPYGRTKVMVEQDLAKLADDNFSPTYMRNATAYGISPRHRFDIVLNNLVAWAYTTGLVYLKSDGSPWRPIVHIEDISGAAIAALEAPQERIHNQAFNVGRNEENYRIRELAEIVIETVPGSRLEFAPDAEPDTRTYRVNFDKITAQLPEFQPKWDARQGAQELYKTYKKYGVELDEFEGPKYKRIDHIKMLISQGLLDANLRWTTVAEREAAQAH